MIRIDRGAEPRGLKIAAPRRLKTAVKVFNQHGAPSEALLKKLTGYGARNTKLALFRAQHEKCAWCERLTDFSSAPVDHFPATFQENSRCPSNRAHPAPAAVPYRRSVRRTGLAARSSWER